MSQFKFDFNAIKGLTYEEGFKALFQQLEDHYNANVNVKPAFVFGADPAQPMPTFEQTGPDTVIARNVDVFAAPKNTELVRVEPEYEIKDGKDLGLKAGAVLVGIRSDTKAEVFDLLKNYTPGDQIVEGDSGKYDLGRK